MSEPMLRDEVERLLAEGVRWQVTLCGGGTVTGHGTNGFPTAIVSEVPNPAQMRKLRRGGPRRTYAFAELGEDEGGPLLLVEEG